jgi:predicted CDP-diglyceride synthetase/phosphatidate cytidylyltransferase
LRSLLPAGRPRWRRRSDDHHHRSLFLAFFVVEPLQYWLIEIDWYGLVAIFIPV